MSSERRSAKDLVDLMKGKAPEYLDLLTAESDNEFELAFQALLEQGVQHLESNSKNYATLNEEGLTAAFAARLSIPGLTVIQEANSNGHVDLIIDAAYCSPARRKLGEAKIYRGAVYHEKGLEQLLKRYTTGREGRSLLLVYVKAAGISRKMQQVREHLDETLPLRQKGTASDHALRWSFVTVHSHDCGDECHVDHIGCNLYHA